MHHPETHGPDRIFQPQSGLSGEMDSHFSGSRLAYCPSRVGPIKVWDSPVPFPFFSPLRSWSSLPSTQIIIHPYSYCLSTHQLFPLLPISILLCLCLSLLLSDAQSLLQSTCQSTSLCFSQPASFSSGHSLDAIAALTTRSASFMAVRFPEPELLEGVVISLLLSSEPVFPEGVEDNPPLTVSMARAEFLRWQSFPVQFFQHCSQAKFLHHCWSAPSAQFHCHWCQPVWLLYHRQLSARLPNCQSARGQPASVHLMSFQGMPVCLNASLLEQPPGHLPDILLLWGHPPDCQPDFHGCILKNMGPPFLGPLHPLLKGWLFSFYSSPGFHPKKEGACVSH